MISIEQADQFLGKAKELQESTPKIKSNSLIRAVCAPITSLF